MFREREREREMESVCTEREGVCFEIEREGVCAAIERVCGEIERWSVHGERKRGRDSHESVCRMIEMCL